MTELNKIIDIIKKLRDPKDGCPWDRKQTHYSLLPYLLEETYELVEAINSKKKKNIKEELGDVLLQILLHAEIASEKNNYDIKDVINICINNSINENEVYSYFDSLLKSSFSISPNDKIALERTDYSYRQIARELNTKITEISSLSK